MVYVIKANFLAEKLAKIAENCDHNIDQQRFPISELFRRTTTSRKLAPYSNASATC
jgi:hypothetical protein